MKAPKVVAELGAINNIALDTTINIAKNLLIEEENDEEQGEWEEQAYELGIGASDEEDNEN